MEHRAPSSLALSADVVLRRRSGTYQQLLDRDSDSEAHGPHDEEEAHDEEEKDLRRRPTVMLVRRALASPTLPVLPRFVSFSLASSSNGSPTRSLSECVDSRISSPLHSTRAVSPAPSDYLPSPGGQSNPPSLSTVPHADSPRPAGPQRADTDTNVSFQSIISAASTNPPLPTPDFSQAPPSRFLRSLFPRGLSFLSNVSIPRPLSSRAESSLGSAYSDSNHDASEAQSLVLPTPDFTSTPAAPQPRRGRSLLSYASSRPFFSRTTSSKVESPSSQCGAVDSPMPFLPIPDFSLTPRLLARGLSLLSYAPRLGFDRAPSLNLDAPFCGPHVKSEESGARGSSVFKEARIKSAGAIDKLTHKWPRPQSLRADTSVDAEEDGPGVDKAEPWTPSKSCLLFSVCTVFIYGGAALICALMTWFRTWDQADVMYVADNDVLILITLAGAILVFTALVGLSGVLLSARPILAVYALLLWPALAAMVSIGYVAYKRATFSLDHKLNLSWSQYYTPLGRLLLQDSLHCCGFYSALHEATPSKRCYPRTALPGCKGKLYRFERANLALIWSTVFSLVPLHLLNVLLALLCSNHVTETFGRGLTPEKYRLTSADVRTEGMELLRGVKRVETVCGSEEHQPSSCATAGSLSDGGETEHMDPFLLYADNQYRQD